MKKILFLILFIPLFSCNDWLNVESEVSVTYRNYFQNESDIEKIFISMLGQTRKAMVSPSATIFDYVSYNIDKPSSGITGFRGLDPEAFSTNHKDFEWSMLYGVIYLGNMLEENRNRFENVSEERADYWLAQANFLKGLMYFEIARRWGDAPLAPSTEDASPRAKSPADTILAHAIRAAKAALILPTHDKLTDSHGAAIQSRQYASKGTVHALLANIYAWLGGLHGNQGYWEKAEKEASMVIDGKAGFYDLVSLTDLVEKTFGPDRDVTEVIYAFEFNEQDDDRFNMAGSFSNTYPGMDMMDYPYTTTDVKSLNRNSNKNRISQRKVQRELYPDTRDLRRKEFWYKLGERIETDEIDWIDEETGEIYYKTHLSTYAFLNKWRKPVLSVNPASLGSLICMEGNSVYWRLADLILLRAECRAHLGMPEAIDDLNRIRERAGSRKYDGATDKTTLLREIFDERDRELYGETCRYYDVVRNGYFREEFDGNYKTLTNEDVQNGALYLPVSKNAFSKNPLMKQNTYWSWYLK